MKTINLLAVLASILFIGCDLKDSTKLHNQYSATPKPTIDNVNAKQVGNANSNQINAIVDDSETENEITACSPEKIYRGETFKVSFKESHGKNFAIYNEKTREFYFLTANNRYYFPFIAPDEFEKLSFIELDTLKVRNNSEKLDSEGYYIPKPYFTKTGWYEVIIGHQALDVDFEDMPVTGSCRIYYVNEKRPKKK